MIYDAEYPYKKIFHRSDSTMEYRYLRGLKVSAIGLGCMGFSQSYPPFPEKSEAILTGAMTKGTELPENDFRRAFPRFQGDNYQKNLELAEYVRTLAEQKGVAPSQIALAWVMSQGESIVPIPGTKKISRIEENIGSLRVSFTPEELTAINAKLNSITITGTRYPEAHMKIAGGR